MSTKPKLTCHRVEDAQALLASEREYFMAGAQNRSLCAGTLSQMPGLQHLPAGCVLHSVATPPQPGHVSGWLRVLERSFIRAGSRLCRFYLIGEGPALCRQLTAAGYTATEEIGYARELGGDLSGMTPHIGLRPLDTTRDWSQKVQLCVDAGHGPDGHDMHHGAYATLERSKCRSGYMRSYLYWLDGRAVGAVSLALLDGFARLKNLLVHPEYRGQGIGRAMVIGTMAIAIRQGAERCGVFGATNTARHLYESCGLTRSMSQTEWAKAL